MESGLYRLLRIMVVVGVVASVTAIFKIQAAPTALYESGNVSPLGYTFSLALFVFPVAGLVAWFATNRSRINRHWKAFWVTFCIIVPLWSLLDIFLANVFFSFPNRDATLGIDLPGYLPGEGWGLHVPIEEFLFYITGCTVIVLLYVWGSEVWFSAYTRPDEAYMRVRSRLQIAQTWHGRSALVGLAILALGLLAKKVGPAPDGFPLYFSFLVLLVVVPSAMAFRLVAEFVNLQAFLFTLQALLLVSLMWEVTLALPYGWWNYQERWMLGIQILPWSRLPIEAPMLWFAAAWSNIGIYELAKLFFFSEQPLRKVFTVKRGATS